MAHSRSGWVLGNTDHQARMENILTILITFPLSVDFNLQPWLSFRVTWTSLPEILV